VKVEKQSDNGYESSCAEAKGENLPSPVPHWTSRCSVCMFDFALRGHVGLSACVDRKWVVRAAVRGCRHGSNAIAIYHEQFGIGLVVSGEVAISEYIGIVSAPMHPFGWFTPCIYNRPELRAAVVHSLGENTRISKAL